MKKLQPVSYNRKNDPSKKSEYCFIAQDVEKLLNEFNVQNTGMLTKDSKGMYEMRYNDLISILVKAI